jgi:histone-lysine N-methyltransferase SUV420H
MAEKELLAMPGLNKYLQRLPNNCEREWFKRHLRKYIQIYLPDCPFEISTTNRYTITQQEAAVTARKDIKKGDEIKHLCGTLVSITREEELNLDLARKDFSIVMSSRRKAPSLFLGPARFANHDCNANGRLVTRGSDGMQIVAACDIDIGQEITVSYGDDYFGTDNCECLCETCERAVRNGWSPALASRPKSNASTPGLEDETASIEMRHSSTFPSKRKIDSESGSDSPPMISTSRKKAKSERQASKLRVEILLPEVTEANDQTKIKRDHNGEANKATSSSISEKQAHGPDDPKLPEQIEGDGATGQKKRQFGFDSETDKSVSPTPRKKPRFQTLHNRNMERLRSMSPEMDRSKGTSFLLKLDKSLSTLAKETEAQSSAGTVETPVATSTNLVSNTDSTLDSTTDHDSPRSSNDDGQQSSVSTTATSLSDDDNIKIESIECSIETATVQTIPVESTGQQPLELESDNRPSSQLSPLSELSHSCELDDRLQTVVDKVNGLRKKSPRKQALPSVEDECSTPGTRVPGDYTKTAKLLAQRYDRWVDCQTCSQWFLQQNAYLTRKECFRCERHSKLYGFQWPKTDSEGPHDDEERVLDHRMVHRFLTTEEEAKINRRSRGVSFGVTPTPELPAGLRSETESSETEGRRTTRANQRRTRDLRKTM